MGFEPQSNMGEVSFANTCAAIAEDSSGDWSTNTSTVNVILTNGFYGYDANGNLTNDGFKYRFSSKEWEPNAGLYYYGYRFYDPNLQRWLNRDPLGELGFETLHRMRQPNTLTDQNQYVAMRNSPIDYCDLFGLDCADTAVAAFENCMGTCNSAVYGPLYEHLDNALKAAEWGAFGGSGIFQHIAGFGLSWAVRAMIMAEADAYGGTAAGCAASAIGAFMACGIDNSDQNQYFPPLPLPINPQNPPPTCSTCPINSPAPPYSEN